MARWLAATAVMLLSASTGAQAQKMDLHAIEVGEVAKNRALDFRIPPDAGIPAHQPLVSGMILRRSLAPNADIGLGLSNGYGKRKSGDYRPGDRLVRSRKPAVTFVLKF